jgi:hypothetical protein
MGRFLENYCPMGWDGTENFLESHPTIGRRFFSKSHPIPWDKYFCKNSQFIEQNHRYLSKSFKNQLENMLFKRLFE